MAKTARATGTVIARRRRGRRFGAENGWFPFIT